MNKRIIMLMAAVLALLSASGQVEFTGGSLATYSPIVAPESTNDFKIYVIYDIQDVVMHYQSETGERPKVCSFESYPDEIDGVQWNGFETTLNRVREGGYIINDTYRFWVVNYADHYLVINGLSINDESPCDLIKLDVDGRGDAITYKTYGGNSHVLDRKIELKYNTLEFINDSTNSRWEQVEVIDTFPSIYNVSVAPPLCSTEFEMSGDYYLERWNIEKKKKTVYFNNPQAVSCNAIAVHEYNGEYTLIEHNAVMRGLAPYHIIFTGYPTDAATTYQWQIATDESFENIIETYDSDVMEKYFDDMTTFYIRFMVKSESCGEIYSETYIIAPSVSELGKGERGLIPNVFTPNSTYNTNDIWKIPCKSLIEFHCWIFDRWGNLLYEYTDPEGGWDGKYHGKLVDTGVYYYVATGKGIDGVKHNRSGDINILRISDSAGAVNNNGGY